MQEYSHSSQLLLQLLQIFFINPFRINHYPDEYWGIWIYTSLGFGMKRQWYYITNRNNIIDKVKSDITRTTFLLSPGLSVNLSSRISLEASLGIIYFSNTTSEIVEPDIASTNPKKTDTDLGVSFDLSNLSFGIMVFL
jgi:hypothetical protein